MDGACLPNYFSATISRRENAPITTLTITDRGADGFAGGQFGEDVTGRRTSLFQVLLSAAFYGNGLVCSLCSAMNT